MAIKIGVEKTGAVTLRFLDEDMFKMSRNRQLVFKNDDKYISYTDYRKAMENQIANTTNSADKQKLIDKMRRLNITERGIRERLEVYRKAMEKQGMKGKQLEEQVARYKDGLYAERQKYYNGVEANRRRAEIAKLKPKPTPTPTPTPKPTPKGKNIPWKKLGKWAGIGLLISGAIVGIAALVKGCSNDKKSAEETPVVPPTQAPEPTPAEPKTAIVHNGDSFDDVAKRFGTVSDSIVAYNKDKIHQFPSKNGKADGFLVGEEINLPKTAKVVEDKTDKKSEVEAYEEYIIKNLEKYPRNKWDALCTKAFRKEHKIGEYKVSK